MMIFEILVPKDSNSGRQFTIKHHKEWDVKVREITGGLTVQRKTKGTWISKRGELILEEMIPVKIACTPEEFQKIMRITIEHYNQYSVLGYLISNVVYTLDRKNNKINKEIEKAMSSEV